MGYLILVGVAVVVFPLSFIVWLSGWQGSSGGGFEVPIGISLAIVAIAAGLLYWKGMLP